jgi:TPP-dependent pyruvate/acetoin dehydrogenase alpha subunit
MASDESIAGGSVAGRGAAYGIEGRTVDGNDVVAVQECLSELVAAARAGEGPQLVEAVTYRYRGHSKSDRNLYRTQEEIEEWRTERDPIARFEGRVREAGLLDDEAVEAARAVASQRIRDAVQEAVRSPRPEVDVLVGSAYAADLRAAT